MVYHISEFLLSSTSVSFTSSSLSLVCWRPSRIPHCSLSFLTVFIWWSQLLLYWPLSEFPSQHAPRCPLGVFTVSSFLHSDSPPEECAAYSCGLFLLSKLLAVCFIHCQPTSRTQTSALTVFSWAPLFISSAIAVGAYLRVCGSLSGNFSVDMLVIMLFLKIFF